MSDPDAWLGAATTLGVHTYGVALAGGVLVAYYAARAISLVEESDFDLLAAAALGLGSAVALGARALGLGFSAGALGVVIGLLTATAIAMRLRAHPLAGLLTALPGAAIMVAADALGRSLHGGSAAAGSTVALWVGVTTALLAMGGAYALSGALRR